MGKTETTNGSAQATKEKYKKNQQES